MASRARRSPLGLIALILAVTVMPLSILLWLGFKVVTTERSLEKEQADDQAKIAADVVVTALKELVAKTEREVASGLTVWPAGAAMVTMRRDGLTVDPKHALAFYPVGAALAEAPPSAFDEVDAAEHPVPDGTEVRRLLQALTRDSNAAVRANAVLRLANLEAINGRRQAALRRYDELLSIDDIGVGGVPLALLARWARCRLLENAGDRAAFNQESEHLFRDLRDGRWELAEATYRLYSADAARWQGRPGMPVTDREALAQAVARVWAERSSAVLNDRDSFSIGDRIFTVLKVKSERFPRALVATHEVVDSLWLAEGRKLAEASGVALAVGISAASNANADVRPRELTGLPWAVALTRHTSSAVASSFESRRNWMLAGLGVVVVMALMAAYVIVRAVNREIAVARLQSDFVAAVSHEFRTPLTSLRQFTGMLSDGTAVTEDTRQVCYDAQARATDRLTKLVESVLDFGRMEAGAKPYHFEVHDCADIVSVVVNDFRREAKAKGYQIEFQSSDTPRIEVDREALSRAIWNLLDNAIKYSPGRQLVEVALGRRPDGVSITVRDYGIGVPAQERQAIFERFARGGEAQTRGINGTGIGLSMVDHIVRAHRGRIELESEVGKGSCFTLILPTRV